MNDEKKKPLKDSLDYKTKWAMIVQDKRAEQFVSGRKSNNELEEDTAQPLIHVLSDLAGEMWTATKDSTARAVERHTNRNSRLAPVGHRVSEALQTNAPPTISVTPSTSIAYEASASDRNSPEFYIRKFMEADLRAVTPVLADNLAVSLRTRPLE